MFRSVTLVPRTLVGILAAMALVGSIGCARGGSSTAPTASESRHQVEAGSSHQNSVTTISWRCVTSSVLWQTAGCPAATRALYVANAAVASTAPAGPTGLAGSAAGNLVTLRWLAPIGGDPPTSYVVEAGSASGRADLASVDTGATGTSLAADNVGAGTYFVRVRARNSAGASTASNEVVVTVLDSTGPCGGAPGAPGHFAASSSGTIVSLSWTASAGATSYVIEAGSFSGANHIVLNDTGTTATFYTSVAPTGTYYVRLRAKNLCGLSAPANEVVLRVGVPGLCGFDAVGSRQLLFEGDSQTGLRSGGWDYPTQLIRSMGYIPCNAYVNNLGVGGSTVAAMAGRASSADARHDAHKANHVFVVWIGTNDLYAGASGASTYSAIVEYGQARRAAGWKVVVLTVLPTSKIGMARSYETERGALNRRITSTWATFADRLVDVAADSRLSDSANLVYFDADKLHLVENGYAVVASLVSPAVLSLF